MRSIDEYLSLMIERDASDLHLMANDLPRMRQYGVLMPAEDRRLDPETVRMAVEAIITPKAREELEQSNGADFAYALPGKGRFRVNLMRHLGGMGAVFRAIPERAKTLEELDMPRPVREMCQHKQGLILVTGKTGSGKSTTLAAMIDHINNERKGHIVTIEDPIEFTHERKKCLISQRELGVHTPSFASALHSALREDPDVVLVGEMRDLDTMSIAVTAAETGILVMGTLHTNGAPPTVDRIVNTFPADKQSHIRSMLSTSIRGVISQQLVPRKDGKGRVAALEILVNNPAVANLIRQGKLDQLESTMQSSAQAGMQTMDTALKRLVQQRLITGEAAYDKAFNKHNFKDYAPAGAA